MVSARKNIATFLRTDRTWMKEFFAEFLGTAFFILAGNGAVAQMKLRASPVLNHGFTDLLSASIGYGLAIAFGVYIAIGVSGGHLNPAVTLAMCLFGKLPWSKLPVYWLAQYLGAFVGSVVIYITYIDSINALEAITSTANSSNIVELAGIFTTFPAGHMRAFPAFLDEVVATAIFLLCVFALVDPRNAAVPKCLIPLLVGLLIVMVASCYGIQSGCAINPARDLGPRLFAMIVWGDEVFWRGNSHFNYFFWIPIVGPYVGAVLGAAIYEGLIGVHFQPVVGTDEHHLLHHHDNVENVQAGVLTYAPDNFTAVAPSTTPAKLIAQPRRSRTSYERLHDKQVAH